MPSRADSYTDFYARSRPRLLHQTYAFCGNTAIARESLSDAYVDAAHHWRKLGALPQEEQDAWLRQRAFRATTKPELRSTGPWYVTARSTAEDHRGLLRALLQLATTDRQLVIGRCLAGLSLPAAAREAGVTDTGAQSRLEGALSQLSLAGAGPPSEQAAAEALDRLRTDLHDELVDKASSLRREGNRRRRAHVMLAGLTSLAVAIGAGALTAAQPSPDAVEEPEASPSSPPSTIPTGPTTPVVVDPFSTASLLTRSGVRALDQSRPWAVTTTSLDFGLGRPLDDCYLGDPGSHARHHWTRHFTSGSGDSPNQAVEVLEVAARPSAAQTAYRRAVAAFTTCPAGTRQVVDVTTAPGLGDANTFVSQRYVDDAQVREQLIAVVRSGLAVVTWLVRSTPAHPVRPRALVTTASQSVDAVCEDGVGGGKDGCTSSPYDVVDRQPPPPESGRGFLSAVDLPRFASIQAPWVATKVKPVDDNPSATLCDRADFAAAGADTLRARTDVIPGARHVPDIFGLTQTVGGFASPVAARAFMSTVATAVAACSDRQPSVTVPLSDDVSVGKVHGQVWQIDAATSQNKTFTFRVALLRLGATVTQITFTPAGKLDIEHDDYVAVAVRAAQRLTQL